MGIGGTFCPNSIIYKQGPCLTGNVGWSALKKLFSYPVRTGAGITIMYIQSVAKRPQCRSKYCQTLNNK